MPELPEVETVRIALRPHLVGRHITAVEVYQAALRFQIDPRALNEACVGHRICDIRRRGKYLLLEVEENRGLVMHLGMTGGFRVTAVGDPIALHEHVAWSLDNGRSLRFVDPRRFGMIVPVTLPEPGATPDMLRHLGPEPLSDEFEARYLARTLTHKAAPIKNALLDQTVVAGLGNIYVNEALFRSGISPRRRGRNIGNQRSVKLVSAITDVLTDALACGGTTIRDFKDIDGSEGHFAVCLDVYGRHGQNCRRCDAEIRRIMMAGRSTFYCPQCQR